MGLLHLPKSLTAAEKAAPQEVKLHRDIRADEALAMIAMQQGKIVRLLGAFSNLENQMQKQDEIRAKAVQFAARKAGELRALNDKWTKQFNGLMKCATEDIERLQDEVIFLKALLIKNREGGDGFPQDMTLSEAEYNEYKDWEMEINYPIDQAQPKGNAIVTYNKPEANHANADQRAGQLDA